MVYILSLTTKKATVYINYKNVLRKRPVSIDAYLQDFRAASDACSVYVRAAVWIVNHFLAGVADLLLGFRCR